MPLAGGAVVQCRVDYAFTLLVDGACGLFELRIEQPFELRGFEAHPTPLTLEGDPRALSTALGVLHADVEDAVAFKDGVLEVRFATGGSFLPVVQRAAP